MIYVIFAIGCTLMVIGLIIDAFEQRQRRHDKQRAVELSRGAFSPGDHVHIADLSRHAVAPRLVDESGVVEAVYMTEEGLRYVVRVGDTRALNLPEHCLRHLP